MAERVVVSIPQETVNDESVKILIWHVPSGSRVDKDQLVCEAETSKAVMEIHSPETGTLVYSAAVGSEVPVGAMICEIVTGVESAGTDGPVADAAAAMAEATKLAGTPQVDGPPARFTPLALKVAAEHGVDIGTFAAGTLVRRNDVLKRIGLLPPDRVLPAKEVPAGIREPIRATRNSPSAGVPVVWSDLPRRKVVEGTILATGMAAAVASSVTTICKAPGLRASSQSVGYPAVGFNAVVLFEVARLLRKYPVFNAVRDGNRIGTYGQVNVGWAIDGGQKLVVPVVPRTDEKNVAEIAAVMQEQLEGYVDDSLAPAAFVGGTFVVTDLSGDGVSFFQPLISQGQCAILGIGSDPSHRDGEIFYLTLTFDHQLAEGRTAAKFLGDLRDRLESHSLLGEKAGHDELYCALCQRDRAALGKIKAILLQSAVPEGYVCSLCVGGWR